jgi:AraC-like DNA-binding protein
VSQILLTQCPNLGEARAVGEVEIGEATAGAPAPGDGSGPIGAQVPTERFDTRMLAPDERLTTFRHLTASLFDVWALGDPAGFDVQATGHHVGGLVFNHVHYNSPARFRRGPEHCRDVGGDFMVLEWMLSGENRLAVSGRQVRCVAGHFYLRDWAREFESHSIEMHLHSIAIPRHLIETGAMVAESDPVLSWSQAEPGGRQLSKLWSGLLEEFADAAVADAENLVDAFLGFLDGLLGRHKGANPRAELGAMLMYLNARLQGDVTVEDLCDHFSVSRSQLYRHFEPVGGVRSYLTRARLERCFTDLLVADPAQVRVADVASSWGFTEASTFSRRFRAMFDTTPSAVLETPPDRNDHLPRSGVDTDYCRRYMQWFQELSGRREPGPPGR